MTFDEWFYEQHPNVDLSEKPVVAVKEKMWSAWCAALEWGKRPTSTNSAMDAIPALATKFISDNTLGMREREAIQWFVRWSQEQHQ